MPTLTQRHGASLVARLTQIAVAAVYAAAVSDAAAMGSRQVAHKLALAGAESAQIEPGAILVETLIEIRSNHLVSSTTRRNFSTGAQTFVAWAEQKRQVNAAKTFINGKLDRVGAFLYPGREDLAVVTFDQDYSSSTLSNEMKKRQYWIFEKGAWRILYEGSA
ncbi:MAG: hypothetical protein ABIS45_10325 [Burkholderiales bacterium]